MCVGALPLSKRADADVKDVKDRLEKLAGKITEAAEKVCSHTYTLLCFSFLCHHCNDEFTDYSLKKRDSKAFGYLTAPGHTRHNQPGETVCREAVQ